MITAKTLALSLLFTSLAYFNPLLGMHTKEKIDVFSLILYRIALEFLQSYQPKVIVKQPTYAENALIMSKILFSKITSFFYYHPKLAIGSALTTLGICALKYYGLWFVSKYDLYRLAYDSISAMEEQARIFIEKNNVHTKDTLEKLMKKITRCNKLLDQLVSNNNGLSNESERMNIFPKLIKKMAKIEKMKQQELAKYYLDTSKRYNNSSENILKNIEGDYLLKMKELLDALSAHGTALEKKFQENGEKENDTANNIGTLIKQLDELFQVNQNHFLKLNEYLDQQAKAIASSKKDF